MIPIKIFLEKNVNPKPGMTLALDNNLVKIVSVSGGRVLVDFNNPLVGKEIEYDFTIEKKVDELNEKIKSILDFFLNQDIKFDIEDKIIILDVPEVYKYMIEQLNAKFQEIIGKEFVIKKEENLETNSE